MFYDGACPVCRREIGWYRKMRGAEAISWQDVADPATPIPSGVDRAQLLRRFTVIRVNGEAAQGAAGFSALWRALRPTRLLGRLTDREPFRSIGEVLYRAFLRIRSLWR
ncbi:MAG: thiol-disulfide oxidoreductase DCC family protein [Pikeienuella sp.]